MKHIIQAFVVILLVVCSCTSNQEASPPKNLNSKVSLIILGTFQDGGSPHAGCNKKCCIDLFSHPDPNRKVVSLGLIDHENKTTWIFEATPDLPEQMKMLKIFSGFKTVESPDGILLTHAHIGHYAGLMYFGREVMNSKAVPVFVMPRMKHFLETNGPWGQLVSLENIQLMPQAKDSLMVLSKNIRVVPYQVPHRDEYSETVGYRIETSGKKVLFIPDIDKWSKWDKNIVEEIKNVDYAFVDGTFFDGTEINNRNISEIPHPFVIETMTLLSSLPAKEKNKIHFIHFNHTNPLADKNSAEYKRVIDAGFRIAEIKMEFEL
jgi:pyrroloquinoline quinone biosynthesis protein B